MLIDLLIFVDFWWFMTDLCWSILIWQKFAGADHSKKQLGTAWMCLPLRPAGVTKTLQLFTRWQKVTLWLWAWQHRWKWSNGQEHANRVGWFVNCSVSALNNSYMSVLGISASKAKGAPKAKAKQNASGAQSTNLRGKTVDPARCKKRCNKPLALAAPLHKSPWLRSRVCGGSLPGGVFGCSLDTIFLLIWTHGQLAGTPGVSTATEVAKRFTKLIAIFSMAGHGQFGSEDGDWPDQAASGWSFSIPRTGQDF